MNDVTDNYLRAQQEKRTRIQESAKRFIWVTFQREGIHKFPAAATDSNLADVAYEQSQAGEDMFGQKPKLPMSEIFKVLRGEEPTPGLFDQPSDQKPPEAPREESKIFESKKSSQQIDAFVHAVRERRALMLSPTASGKSFIIYLLVRYYAKRTLILVPTTSLVSQLSSDFADYGFDSDAFVHRVYAGQDKGSTKPITISTWQSLYKLPKEFFNQFDVIIGDEAHLFKAKSLTSILTQLP